MFEKSRTAEAEPIEAGIAVEPKLYEAYSIVDDFMGHDRVKFHWFCWMRAKPIGQYEQLIRDFEPGDCSEGSINECFTESEIEQLREYLERVHDLELYINKIDLPVPKDLVPYSYIGSFSTCKIYANGEIGNREIIENYYMMNEDEGYSLPFDVCGYFNLEE